ncbi:hypothetical protein PIB30_008330 [Stylosanthes scabra]|uniref:DUF4283 domain-containing protein n=1 Tax=Stylosanthes scabra TaxID=79078 RepID=A0ABU6T6W9_9FABA|nr:hypothetical protein [Stylosanthes scabra]
MVENGAGQEAERREEEMQVVMSNWRARNENELEGTTVKRSYVSMVKGSDFVFHSESEDEDYSSEEMSESEEESEFEYSDEEGIKPGTEEWEDKRLIPRRKVVWDEEGTPTLMLNKAEQRRLNSYWCNTLIVKLMGRRIGYGVLKKRLDTMWGKEGAIRLIDVGCGKYGHTIETCPEANKKSTNDQGKDNVNGQGREEGEGAKGQAPQGQYGDWMKVQRYARGKRGITGKDKGKAAVENQGSRFAMLQEEEKEANSSDVQEGMGEKEGQRSNGQEKEKRIFLSGSEMRKERAKLVVVLEEGHNSQETVTCVPETQYAIGTRSQASPKANGKGQHNDNIIIPMITKDTYVADPIGTNDEGGERSRDIGPVGGLVPDPKPPDISKIMKGPESVGGPPITKDSVGLEGEDGLMMVDNEVIGYGQEACTKDNMNVDPHNEGDLMQS